MIIEKEKAVFLHYTLKNDKGEVLDSSEGNEPLAYIHGLGNLIFGLEKQLEGKKTGDMFTAVVPPEEGYGKWQESLVRKESREKLNSLGELNVGLRFTVKGPQGPMAAIITELSDTEVTVDLNHPLADSTLHFDVKIEDIRNATAEELEHGHIHGPGGHQH